MNIYSIILFVFTIAAVVISGLLFVKVKSTGKYLSFVLLSAAFWAGMYAAELLQTDLVKATAIVELQYVGIAFLPAAWMVFVLKYLQKDKLITRRNVALLFFIPVTTIVLVWTNSYHQWYYLSTELVREENFAVFRFSAGPWYILFTIWFYATLCVGLYLLLVNRNKGNSLFRTQTNFLVAASTIPWIANVIYLMGYRLDAGIDITPFAFILSTLSFSYALLRYRLLNIVPIARERIVEALKEGVLVIDTDCRIVEFNPEMLAILNKEDEMIAGAKIETVLPEFKEIRSGATELTLTSADSRRIFFVTSNQLNSKKGKALGRVFLFNDITKLKDIEENLIKARVEAEQAAQAKGDFLSTMSHEIRTPMNAILGFTHVLLQNNPREDQREFLKIQKFSAENLLVLINDILDFAKIEAGKINFESASLDLKALLTNICNTLKGGAEEKRIGLVLNLPKDEIPLVIGDAVRLSQIFTNLISNAIKFTEAGQVSIDALVRSRNDRSIVLGFEVKDTGIGIAADRIDQIFESFTQASSDTTRKFGGTGLGLTITRRLLELLHSEIKVASIPGKGSVFSFDLEFEIDTATAKIDPAQVVGPEYLSFSGKKVLIVDDNPMNVLLAKQFMKKWDLEYGVAKDGAEALEAVQTEDYHLVLMDLQMPVMDGYTATSRIRELPDQKYRKLPVVALSASAMAEVQTKVFEAGMNDLLTKPFTPDALYEKLKSAFFSAEVLHGASEE